MKRIAVIIMKEKNGSPKIIAWVYIETWLTLFYFMHDDASILWSNVKNIKCPHKYAHFIANKRIKLKMNTAEAKKERRTVRERTEEEWRKKEKDPHRPEKSWYSIPIPSCFWPNTQKLLHKAHATTTCIQRNWFHWHSSVQSVEYLKHLAFSHFFFSICFIVNLSINSLVTAKVQAHFLLSQSLYILATLFKDISI